MSNAILTYDLTKMFRRVEALKALNLEVPEGAIYALVGPNGAGKTTTIKILMNILRATTGEARVLGKNSKHVAGSAFESIGYVSENQEVPGWMRIESFLAYLRPFYPTWDTDLEADLIRQFQLPLNRKLRELSRGMRMKAVLASSLAYHPKLIVLDEPFAGLDPLVRDELIEGLLERAAESTVFVSSHDLAEIESFASHVGYLERGQLRFSEELSSLSERFRQVELTFERPPTLPNAWPDSWLQPGTSAAVVRFIDSRFDQEQTSSKIQSLFGAVRNATFTPMTLRSIFLAMAKSGRTVLTKGEA